MTTVPDKMILVRFNPGNMIDAVDVCKQIEALPSVDAAVLVRNGSTRDDNDSYVCTVYTTPQARERIDGQDVDHGQPSN